MDIFQVGVFRGFINENITSFESRIVWILAIFFALLSVNIIFTLATRNALSKSSYKTSKLWSKKTFDSLSEFTIGTRIIVISGLIIPIIINILAVFFILNIVLLTLYERPRVVSHTPGNEENMTSAIQNIEIVFDLPADLETLEFNISPAVDGEWQFEEDFYTPDATRKATFVPKETFAPDQIVVVYVTGMRNFALNDGVLHEQAIEFFSPKSPEVLATSPGIDDLEVPTDAQIKVNYDAPLADFVSFDYKIEPKVEFEVRRERSTEYIEFNEPLDQDSRYDLEVFRTLKSYERGKLDEATDLSTEKIYEYGFQTVSTPLVNSFSPKGNAVIPTESIVLNFDIEMNKEEVESKFRIEPNVEGEFVWDSETQFTFNPNEPLKKDTEYVVTVEKGIMSTESGKTDQDIIYKFTTLGATKVNDVSPINDAAGLETSDKVIRVEFDQPVNKQSAQDQFSVSPQISGTFDWDGDKTLLYNASGFSFDTTYTIKLAKGVESVHGDPSSEDFTSRFSTRPQIFTIDVPWYRQQESFTCNVAASRMVLAYYDIYLPENQIKSGIGTSDNPNNGWVSGYGVHPDPVASYLQQYRTSEIKRNWNTTDMLKEVEQGRPVILWWYNRYSQPAGSFTLSSGATGYNGMHSEVVYGFRGTPENPTAILVRDPWRGSLEYSPQGFANNWGYMDNTAVVVY